MDRIEIEKKIKEKYDDEYTIKMFTNFAFEFQECFSSIMSTEELIERIKKNISGNIKTIDEFKNKALDGKYSEDGSIYLKSSVVENEEYVKYLLFHEMLHAVTSIRDENGKKIMMGFSYLKNSYGMGLNEAMTEYLTQIRNKKFAPNNTELISGYRTVVEQMRRLTLIIGDEELMKAYFYNPDSLKELFSRNQMNYDELEWAYRNLCGKDADVYSIGNAKKIHNTQNYNLHRFSESIFGNYANAIGEVSSLEDFKRKYEIFQKYEDGECDSIITMFLTYYKETGKDIDRLLKRGISFDEIKSSVQTLNMNINAISSYYNFSKCFVDDKNESAIRIYEYYKKSPQAYINMFSRNYGFVFDHFSEYDVGEPENSKLYDMFKYPLIGLLLKEHPEIDYSDVSYNYFEDSKSNARIYIFTSSDGKRYAYMANGEKVTQQIDENGNEVFKYGVTAKCTCSLIYKKDGGINYNFNSTNDFDLEGFMQDNKIKFETVYSEREDLEYWIQKGFDERGELSKKLDKILKRMKKRKSIDFVEP